MIYNRNNRQHIQKCLNGETVRNAKIIEDYKNGIRQKDIAEKYGLSKTRIRQILIKWRVI